MEDKYNSTRNIEWFINLYTIDLPGKNWCQLMLEIMKQNSNGKNFIILILGNNLKNKRRGNNISTGNQMKNI